jgi:hypothetical protein
MLTQRAIFKTSLMLLLALLWTHVLAEPSQNKFPQVDPAWRLYDVRLSYVDRRQRLIVAGDREFKVPKTTVIINREGRRVRFKDLQSGDNIWLYLSAKAKSSGAPLAVKRIELVK